MRRSKKGGCSVHDCDYDFATCNNAPFLFLCFFILYNSYHLHTMRAPETQDNLWIAAGKWVIGPMSKVNRD